MRIKQNVTGETADFLAWNLSTNEHPSYVLVRLNNGSLYEWKIDGCSVVAPQTSDVAELTATDSQQLKVFIAQVEASRDHFYKYKYIGKQTFVQMVLALKDLAQQTTV